MRPEDASALQELLARLAPMDARLLFFAPGQDLPEAAGVRLSQIDYDRQMTLIARISEAGPVLGVARFSADPDNRLARFAVAVHPDAGGRGLGHLLTSRLIEIGAARGIGILFGDIARADAEGQALCRSLGFIVTARPDAPELFSVRRGLGIDAPPDH